MKTKAFFSSLALAVIALALAVVTVNAQPRRGQGQDRPGHVRMKALEKLNLTQAQKDQITSLRDAFKTANQASIEEIKSLREQMREKMKSGDKEGAKAIREQLKAKHEAMKPAREKLHQDVLAILTQEQRDQLAKMKEEMKERRKDHRRGGKGKPGRGPAPSGEDQGEGIE